MRWTGKSKTLTVTISQEAERVFAFLSDPENLPKWFRSLCRTVRRENGAWVVESSQGPMTLRLIRDDRAGLVDHLFRVRSGREYLLPIRILTNGEGAEVLITVQQPQGGADGDHHRLLQWTHEATRQLKQVLEKASSIPTPEPASESPAEEAASEEPPAAQESAAPSTPGPKTLFVGNLPFDWTDDQLRELFTTAGEVVRAEIARFRRNGRSRGFGFIQLASDDATVGAIEKMHGVMAGNRAVTVRESRPRENREPEPKPAPQPDAAPVPQERPPQPPRPRLEPRVRSRRGPRGNAAPTRRETGVFENSGYEFFPRGSSVTGEEPAAQEDVRAHRPSSVEASPYFDDTGDVENRPHRPRRRGGRPTRRGPRRRS